MEGRVKAALYALSEMQKSAEAWAKLSAEPFAVFERGKLRRQFLRRKCQGLVFHDRILTGHSLERNPS